VKLKLSNPDAPFCKHKLTRPALAFNVKSLDHLMTNWLNDCFVALRRFSQEIDGDKYAKVMFPSEDGRLSSLWLGC
jgi:hypothetical protein